MTVNGRIGAIFVAVLLTATALLPACASPPPTATGVPPGGDGIQPISSTPPPQELLVPDEPAEGELGEGETARWIFAAVEGSLATVEVWFRPATASSPEAQVSATLLRPDSTPLVQDEGTVTLPPYIVEQELDQTGSYLLRLEAPAGSPGRYTLLLTISDERLLTRSDVYTGTSALDGTATGNDAVTVDSWGFIWPSPRRAISGWYFHDPANPGHNGLDIAAALHDPIFAAASGTVSFAGPSGGYGNLVLVDHADGWQTWYAHLSYIAVAVGDVVAQGDTIGAAGSTGYSTGRKKI